MTHRAVVLSQLVRVIAREGSASPLPMRLCHASAELLGADGAAITLSYTEPTRLTVCTTDEIAARIEDLQEILGEGPGPDAYRTGKVVRADLEDRARVWPAFVAAADAEVGAAAISAIPIRAGRAVLGVLTVYQIPARPLEGDHAVAQFLADAVGAALLRDGGLQRDLGAGPWSSRAQVSQATGIVVAQLAVSPEDALALLRAHAFAAGMSMASIAMAVIDHKLDFSVNDSEDNNR